jgi:hypothetical protein
LKNRMCSQDQQLLKYIHIKLCGNGGGKNWKRLWISHSMSEHDIILCFVEWLVQFYYLTTKKSLTKVHWKPSKRRTMPNENSSPDFKNSPYWIVGIGL